MRKFFRIAAAALIVLTAAGAVWGKSGKEHMKLWNDVFGITDKRSADAIEPLWKEAQSVIDSLSTNSGQGGTDYQRLKKECRWFKLKLGEGEHRYLFHWGFNRNPRNHKPLEEKLNRLLSDYVKNNDIGSVGAAEFRDREKKKFYSALTKIQAERNRRLINSVQKTLGIPAARGYANGIATLIYDVHLLSDYATVLTSALPNIDDIERDVTDSGFGRLLGGNKTERLAKIDDDLKAVIRVGRGRTNKKRAELLTEAMKEHLPVILNERFKDTLAQKGITVTVTEGK